MIQLVQKKCKNYNGKTWFEARQFVAQFNDL